MAFVLRSFLMLLLAVVASLPVRAQLNVEITGAGANRIPIAIADFQGDGLVPQGMTAVVRGDLANSGLFKMVDTGATPLPESAQPNFADWRARGADALMVGAILPGGDGKYEVRFRLYDVQRQAQVAGYTYSIAASQYRITGHRVSDVIYEKLLGERSIFSTRIAYVVKSGKRFELQIADADGGNPQTALASHEPIISPVWSPDGNSLAYVSFEAKKPVVYVHSLTTGRRHVVANFKGSNSAPAWSPDGSKLAVVLTRDGGSQMFVVNADGTGLHRLARSSGIDTEPRFSPDGQYIYFTSDRGGSPQVYRMPANGGDAERMTFEGNYNVTPRPSPDGKTLAFIARTNGKFQLAVMDLVSRQVQVLTDSAKDESPSFAPNGRMIIYASEIGGRGVLGEISADGRVKQRLSIRAADVREPAWGPFQK